MSDTPFAATPLKLRVQSVQAPDQLNFAPVAGSAVTADNSNSKCMNSVCENLNRLNTWCLTGSDSCTGVVREYPISTSVFHVGRKAKMHLVLRCNSVSNHHADLIATQHALFVKDLGSTNGTFVNGRRLFTDAIVCEGDVIQFAEQEFRVTKFHSQQIEDTRFSSSPDLSWSLLQFDILMNAPALVPWFQPVVALVDGQVLGYEVLARSDVQGLENPYKMFLTAGRLAMDAPLSELCRTLGLQHAVSLSGNPAIYLNTHPAEELTGRLVEALSLLRNDHPDLPIVIELHEAAVASAAQMRYFRAALNDLQMQLAYDDFGAGQSRLAELFETPPDILKFDMSLIRNIHLAPIQRQKALSMLLQGMLDSGVQPLAEGIECQEEADVCQELGFGLAQGWLFGRPAPLEHWPQQEAHNQTS